MNNKIKIGLVLPAIPGYSETFFRSKIKGLIANNFDVIVFVNKGKKNMDLPCEIVYQPDFSKPKLILSIFIFSKNILLNLSKSKKLFEINRNYNHSIKKSIKNVILNSHYLNHNLDWLHFGFGTMAIGRENVAKAINAKMAVSFRGFDIGIYPLKHKNCYDLLWEKVDKIHVISDDIKQLAIKNGCNAEHKINKITPAIDTNSFSTTTQKSNPTNCFNITTIARLHWKKGLEYTLEALAIIKKSGIDFKYTIIGEGAEKERLQFAAHQLGLTENVIFAGKLAPIAVKESLETTTLYLQYSIQEGFCNSVLEAQAMGLLCIVSDAEGLSENVLDGITGFVVAKRNPKLLAQKIIEIYSLDNISKSTITKNAINRVKNEFGVEKQIEKFISFYQNN
jgi:glycosyltransferase involved in cell wall biosynthesis